MKRPAVVLLLAVVALTGAPAAASADRVVEIVDGSTLTLTDRPITDDRLPRAVRAAGHYWKRLPTGCGPLRGFRAMTSRPGPQAGPWGYLGWVDEIGRCGGYLNVAWLDVTDDASVCMVVVHEIGHMLGLRHEHRGDPAVVMSTEKPGVPAVCMPRSPRNAGDRRWCRRNFAACGDLYPALGRRVGVMTKKEGR